MNKGYVLLGLLFGSLLLFGCEKISTHENNNNSYNPAKTSESLDETKELETETYSFEQSVFIENPVDVYETVGLEIANHMNSDKKDINVSPQINELISELTDTIAETYISKLKPNLSELYDTSNNMRIENKFVVENYAYYKAALKSNKIQSFSNNVSYRTLKKINDDVFLLNFYVVTTLNTVDGEEGLGIDYSIYMKSEAENYRIIKIWVQDYDFVSVELEIQKNISDKEILANTDKLSAILSEEIKKKIESKPIQAN